ncbi:Crp/Fnr family transcriptional regulator [Kytococcus sedentarius]|uniref:cAMP-binding protein n=1 Tax=Kytococcus sedentarius (strain ATCC 14392 / DSM 20547 / JCM 11482 / CCUG 33030 / NBRC 15357 / NCTC 11040 / CCM 314 / 541) TaxID=478801 RepID=C7NKH0_KYTSD|nr:Crp/Fnr family transcriptional regulator [Kytococcus sedentarius]ACV07008.1 cAMP-binding protein [Kytococcus sedentarius DSM 20547]QQB63006.1 Crp/Fnr family transcriptional regulator [Kytococcus sedentarius]STX14164.1 Fumarate and nitrate reduction regulatory protein [Kytococcus sedentarius]
MPQDLCVTQVPIFAGLDPEAQQQVASCAHPEMVEAGHDFYRQGEEVGQLFVLHEGTVKLTHGRADGTQRIVRTVAPGQVVGEHPLLAGGPADHTATAIEPVVACVFQHDQLAGLMGEHPRITRDLLGAMSRRLADAEQRIARLTSTDMAARLADYLLDLPAAVQGRDVRVSLPMRKREVASYLGVTPESFSRALARLEKRGLVEVSGAEIALLDLDGLTELAG